MTRSESRVEGGGEGTVREGWGRKDGEGKKEDERDVLGGRGELGGAPVESRQQSQPSPSFSVSQMERVQDVLYVQSLEEQVPGSTTKLEDGDRLEYVLLNIVQLWNNLSLFTVVFTTIAVRELQLDDSGLLARSDPADLSLEAETVVLQLGGGDNGVGGDHSPT